VLIFVNFHTKFMNTIIAKAINFIQSMLQNGKPLHAQISDWLLSQIDLGKLKPDQKLPSENELASKFDVSRVTVRRALQTLEGDSIIYRCQGLGSFVSDH